MSLGKHFKNIRKNRGFSQMVVSKEIISQGTYSKFEAEIRDIDASVFFHLLNRMNISLEEFEYIRNDYSYGEKQEIIHQFFKLNYNNIKEINVIKRRIGEYLDVQEDLELKEIHLICDAFIQLDQTKDINLVKNIIMPVWQRISNYDQWYFNDIRLINTILFLFPISTAIEFTRHLLDRISKYTDFRNADILKQALLINLSLLLIKNKDYSKSLSIIEESLQQQKKMTYPILALHFSRKAICHYHLANTDPAVFLEKAKQLLFLYSDEEYWERIQTEFIYYTQLKL